MAELSIAALLPQAGALLAGDLRLSLDAMDVTSQATVRESPTSPPSSATISYTPDGDLPIGAHQATVAYPAGKLKPFTWSFTVVDMPCANELPPSVGSSNPGSAIAAVYPADGSTACRRPQIGADVFPTGQMRKGGAFDPSTVTLSLDGKVVAPQAVRETMTYPSSRATILYAPDADLALGDHHATLVYPSSGTLSRTWTFTVADIACE
jgi:hypothetical protein